METAKNFRARVKSITGVSYREIPMVLWNGGSSEDPWGNWPIGPIVARRGSVVVVGIPGEDKFVRLICLDRR